MMGRLMAFWVYKAYVQFAQDVSDPEQYYSIPELGINGSYYEAYRLLARMVWRLQPEILHYETIYKEKLALPSLYDGVHIRGGDKMMETTLISGKHIMEVLHPKTSACVFILTDDYRQYQELQANYPNIRLLTLCRPEERGYLHKAFSHKSPQSRQEAIIRLIISVDLLFGSRSFVGSITTGPSVFVMKQRVDDPFVQAVDCPKTDLASSLSLTIDVRAAISQRYLSHRGTVEV